MPESTGSRGVLETLAVEQRNASYLRLDQPGLVEQQVATLTRTLHDLAGGRMAASGLDRPVVELLASFARAVNIAQASAGEERDEVLDALVGQYRRGLAGYLTVAGFPEGHVARLDMREFFDVRSHTAAASQAYGAALDGLTSAGLDPARTSRPGSGSPAVARQPAGGRARKTMDRDRGLRGPSPG